MHRCYWRYCSLKIPSWNSIFVWLKKVFFRDSFRGCLALNCNLFFITICVFFFHIVFWNEGWHFSKIVESLLSTALDHMIQHRFETFYAMSHDRMFPSHRLLFHWPKNGKLSNTLKEVVMLWASYCVLWDKSCGLKQYCSIFGSVRVIWFAGLLVFLYFTL